MSVKQKYLKDENGNIFSTITSADSVILGGGGTVEDTVSRKIFEKVFHSTTKSFVLNIPMQEGDIIEIYFQGSLSFSDGTSGVANMGLVPNTVSSYNFSRATFFETADGGNNNVNLDSEHSARFIRGETGFGIFSVAKVVYRDNKIFVGANFFAPTGSPKSRQGMIGTYLGNFDEISHFNIVGTGNSQINIGSLLKVYKKC